MARAWLALGSNVGDRHAAIAGAVSRLGHLPGTSVVAVSGCHETEPVGGPAGQGMYLNAAVGVDTSLTAGALLEATQAIERSVGRPAVGDRVKDGPRVLDIDLLLYGDVVIDEPGLTVPHPRMAGRAFVLGPLAEVAPDAVHPGTGRTVMQMRSACRQGVADG